MVNRLISLSLFLLILSSCNTKAELAQSTPDQNKKIEIDRLGNRYLELNRFSGVILIAKSDSIIYKENFGLADYEYQKEFSDKTAFKIGEASELITRAIVEEFARKGNLKLNDKISYYIPEIQATYTIEDLINHKTRLPHIGAIKEQHPDLPYSTIEYARLGLNSPTNSEKSELEYNLLGLLIERISGLSYGQNVQNYSSALGLENTYFQKADSLLAVGHLYHNFRGNGLELQASPVADSDITYSSAGLKSTADDLLKIIRSKPAEEVQIHGFTENDGFSYSVQSDPQTATTVIVLSNFRHPVAGEISNSIRAILAGKEYRLPLLREPFAIDPELLNEYSGSYSLNAQMNIEVLAENDSLFVRMGPNKVHLIPQSQNQFYMAERDASLRFLRDSTRVVNAVELLDGFLDGNKISRSNQ